MRGHGDGSVYERRKGVWRLRLTLTDDRGTHRVSRTIRARTRAQALAELREWSKTAKPRPLRSERRTLGQVADGWLANLEREGRVAPSTLLTYRRWCERWIVPALGAMPVAKVRSQEIDAFYASLTDRLAPATVHTIHATLKGILTQALDWELIESLPRCRPPARARGERKALTPEQVQALVAAARERDLEDLAMAITLGALTGLRRGELCGLQVADLDRDRGILTVQRQIGSERDLVDHLKNQFRRTVALSPETVAVIDDYLGTQRERFSCEPGPWLLSHDGGTTPLWPNRVSEAISRLGRDIGVPAHTHALRHFHDTYLVSSGVDVVTAARRAGHRPEELLRTYAHAVDENDRAAADVLSRLVLAP